MNEMSLVIALAAFRRQDEDFDLGRKAGTMTELWDILNKNGSKTGRLHTRGQPMAKGDFHLVVHVWIVNKKGEFLISKRTENKTFPLMWECTGGSAVAGDDSLTTAVKEIWEELGIKLAPENGKLFMSIKGDNHFSDVWVFHQEVDLGDAVFCPDETCDAMWANKDQINQMIKDGTFIGKDIFTYLDELFAKI